MIPDRDYPLLLTLSQLPSVQSFIHWANVLFPNGFLLTQDSANYGPSQEVLIKAIQEGHQDMIVKYFQQLDMGQIDPLGYNLLHHSIMANQRAIVQLLLSHPSCQINQTTTSGATPLHLAVMIGSLPILQLIGSKRPQYELTDNQSRTVLQLAKEKGNSQMIQYLTRRSR